MKQEIIYSKHNSEKITTVLDKRRRLREMCMEYANNIRQTMQEYGLSENSPVIRDLDRLRF